MTRMPKGQLALLFAAVLLGVVGFAVEKTMTGPRLAEITRLGEKNQALAQEAARGAALAAEAEALAAALGVEDLAHLAGLDGGEEPIACVGRLVEAAGLRRLALLSGETEADKRTRMSRFTLRVAGTTEQLATFLRACESSVRLLRIDQLDIDALDRGGIEAALGLTVIDVVGPGGN